MAPKYKELAWLIAPIAAPPLSIEARREAGYLLYQLQRGDTLSLPHSRPLPGIGTNCHELRIKSSAHEWRIIYRIDGDVIVIVECFPKKTRILPKSIIALCKKRLKDYDEE